jgi:hypothetical protein
MAIRTKRSLTAAIIVLALIAVLWWVSRPASPDQVAKRLEGAVRVGNWEYVFDCASEMEKRSSGLTRSQFCSLMKALCSGVEDQLARARIRNITEWTRDGYEHRIAYSITIPASSSRDLEGVARTYPLLFGRFDSDRWYFDFGPWPQAVSWVYPGDLETQLLRFAECLDSAGIQVLRRFDAPVYTTPDRLRQIAAGRLPTSELWTS